MTNAYQYRLLLELQLSLQEDIVIQACQVFVDPYEEVDELVSKLIRGLCDYLNLSMFSSIYSVFPPVKNDLLFVAVVQLKAEREAATEAVEAKTKQAAIKQRMKDEGNKKTFKAGVGKYINPVAQ